MNDKFDELTKSMAQSVTRRAALKKFGLGLAGMALACFGLANHAEAGVDGDRIPLWCDRSTNTCCCRNCKSHLPTTDVNYGWCSHACGAVFGCGKNGKTA